ncbi:unnamed protein product [Gordionus sp. m RMFG-2023]
MSLISMNFNEPCINHVPTVFESFKAMTPLGFSFLSIATLLSILTFLIFVDELYYIYVKVPYKSHKERLYWVIGIFPLERVYFVFPGDEFALTVNGLPAFKLARILREVYDCYTFTHDFGTLEPSTSSHFMDS